MVNYGINLFLFAALIASNLMPTLSSAVPRSPTALAVHNLSLHNRLARSNWQLRPRDEDESPRLYYSQAASRDYISDQGMELVLGEAQPKESDRPIIRLSTSEGCYTRDPGCTSLDFIRRKTLENFIALVDACELTEVNITGGSEFGHTGGRHKDSHNEGFDIDVHYDDIKDCINKFFKKDGVRGSDTDIYVLKEEGKGQGFDEIKAYHELHPVHFHLEVGLN